MNLAGVKDLVRPPFANYDIVVYFGCGLFALPLINRYLIEPTGFRFPRFQFEIGIPFAQDAVSVLSLLFSVYLLGHMISYCSSLFIEKSIDTFFGKISSAILLSTWSEHKDRPELRQAWRADRRIAAFQYGKRIQNGFRVLVLVPVLPLIFFVNAIGGFDYYRSRVPRKLVFQARNRLSEMGYGPAGLRDPWFKVLEHEVINNFPTATTRMYNYLVIGGIFRSLSVIFLASVWLEWYYLGHVLIDGHGMLDAVMSDDATSLWRTSVSFLVLYVAFGFCLASYMKFSRRYAEEAIFAFVLARP